MTKLDFHKAVFIDDPHDLPRDASLLRGHLLGPVERSVGDPSGEGEVNRWDCLDITSHQSVKAFDQIY